MSRGELSLEVGGAVTPYGGSDVSGRVDPGLAAPIATGMSLSAKGSTRGFMLSPASRAKQAGLLWFCEKDCGGGEDGYGCYEAKRDADDHEFGDAFHSGVVCQEESGERDAGGGCCKEDGTAYSFYGAVYRGVGRGSFGSQAFHYVDAVVYAEPEDDGDYD